MDNFHKIEKNLEIAVEATKSSIDKVISRGHQMSALIEKTGELSSNIGQLGRKAKNLHRNLWKGRIKALTAIFIVGIMVTYGIIVWVSQSDD